MKSIIYHINHLLGSYFFNYSPNICIIVAVETLIFMGGNFMTTKSTTKITKVSTPLKLPTSYQGLDLYYVVVPDN